MLFNGGQKIFGYDGWEFKFPMVFWQYWPKASNDAGLYMIRQNFFYKFINVNWHSTRHFPQFTSLRYRALQAVCEGNIDKLEACLAEGWKPESIIDT